MRHRMNSSQMASPHGPVSSPFIRASLGVSILILCVAPFASAQQGGEKTFSSPGMAAQALYAAVKASDEQALQNIFGSGSQEMLHSGDDVADKNTRKDFLQKYDEMHRVVVEPDNTVTLYTGAENWPFPIPLVKTASNTWYFDAEAGKKEVLYRRVGRNENDAIRVCDILADAQKEYASTPHDGAKQYAQKIMSDEGKQNGLYWKTNENEPPSPIGPLIAYATKESYTRGQSGGPTPFHGYIYRILTRQGPDAPHGAQDYMVKGKLTRGFAFIAYPAEYRNSGVMTFLVNQSGVVYQKDLGPQTAEVANAMQDYNPDSSWDKVED